MEIGTMVLPGSCEVFQGVTEIYLHKALMNDSVCDRASPEQWRLATQAITASCAITCARAWLGYIPAGLLQDTQELLQQMDEHDAVTGAQPWPWQNFSRSAQIL